MMRRGADAAQKADQVKVSFTDLKSDTHRSSEIPPRLWTRESVTDSQAKIVAEVRIAE